MASNVFNETSLKPMSRGGCRKNMLDVCCVPKSYDEYVAMIRTANECQLSAYMLLLGTFATVVCCAEELFQPSFLHVVSTLHAEWSTERTTEPDTAQTERVLTRLVDTASRIAVCIRSASAKQKSLSPQHPCIDSVSILCCPCPCCTQLFVVLGFTLRAWI